MIHYLRALAAKLRGLFWDRRADRDLEYEIETHLRLLTERYIRQGMTEAEAACAARRQFGNVTLLQEVNREMRGIRFIETLFQDVRYGLWMLRRNPGFAAIAIITLALGIGANTAIFSVFQSVVLSPLPYDDPERLVVIWPKNNLGLRPPVSGPDFQDWKRSNRSFDRIGGIKWQARDLTSPGPAEHIDGGEVSSEFFSTLGVKLALGREFSAQEDQYGSAPVVVISYSLWKNRFGGSPEVIGNPITMDGIDYTVVGILPSGFRFMYDADVYTPLGQNDPIFMNDRAVRGILCIGRLKPEVTADQAQADMRAIQNSLNQLYPNANTGLSVDVISLKQQIVGDTDEKLLLLLGAVALVLLIACANVANLLLARSTARNGEFAVRLALGASRARIVRQFITESLILSLAGGVLGLVIAIWGVRPILAALPGNLPRSEEIGVNFTVLLFTFGLTLLVGVLFGALPAFRSSRTDLQTVIRQGGRGAVSGHNRAQSLLVILQMALTLLLLTGASLLFRTVHKLWGVNPGFDARNLITFKVGLSPSATKTPQSARVAFRQLVDRIGEIPGVNAVDLTNVVPLSQQVGYFPFWIGDAKPASIAEAPRTIGYITGPDYLRLMEIPLLRGRFFTPQDTTESEPVVVIDSCIANAYFPGKDPIGQMVTFPLAGAYRIIGVVGHVDHWELGRSDHLYNRFQAYVHFYQNPDRFIRRTATVVVRTPLDPATILPAIKKEVYGAANDQPIYDIKTIDKIVSDSMSSQRFAMILFGAFALLALLLSAVGIYGVLSYLTTMRAGEIGIRMALGAERGDVLRMVLAQGLRMAGAGIVIGIVAALILGRLLSSFSRLLYGVGSGDPLTLISVSLALIGATLLACYVPARRAARVDPMITLRYE
jgi:predicted permease